MSKEEKSLPLPLPEGIEALVFHLGRARVEVRAPAAEMHWLRPLFLRSKDPFKALLEMGFMIGDSCE
jgi:hypothetical protein